MAEKSGTAWIQNLNKKEIVSELKNRGIDIGEETKFEKLREKLRETVKEEVENQTSNSKHSEETKESNKKLKEESDKAKRCIEMEYDAKLDFKMGVDDWEEFVERIEFYWEANDIEEDKKKRAIFLTKIDADTYSIVRKVYAPKNPRMYRLKISWKKWRRT